MRSSEKIALPQKIDERRSEVEQDSDRDSEEKAEYNCDRCYGRHVLNKSDYVIGIYED
tara:strand:- start:115 stop:288 length:174 start_codon:yes stop_codon:yes gene_type:complete